MRNTHHSTRVPILGFYSIECQLVWCCSNLKKWIVALPSRSWMGTFPFWRRISTSISTTVRLWTWRATAFRFGVRPWPRRTRPFLIRIMGRPRTRWRRGWARWLCGLWWAWIYRASWTRWRWTRCWYWWLRKRIWIKASRTRTGTKESWWI